MGSSFDDYLGPVITKILIDRDQRKNIRETIHEKNCMQI